jgi:ATP-dependent RNA helicase HelY
MRLPKSFNPRNPQARRELASRVAAVEVPPMAASKPRHGGVEGRSAATSSTEHPEIADVRRRMKNHPCHACPDRESHARWAERYVKLQRDTDNQRRRIETRTNTVARQFDRVCEVLDALGYLDGDTVTDPGKRLQRIYGELDLVVSESLRHGLWNDLDPPELAAVVSALTFETRADEAPVPVLPTKRVRRIADEMARLGGELQQLERDHRLKTLRSLDFGFAQTVWEWASGADLDDVLAEADIAAGDFVRAVKQVIDALGQISDAAATHELRETARAALVELRRGVIAYASTLE